MKAFLDDDFLLSSDTAASLYHDVARSLPIIDYHCHLPAEDIASDRHFDNLTQIWLDGDHYKWRALRTAGVEEHLITGAASDFEKYIAWAQTVPQCIGNPLYHWTHLELRRPFGIKDTLFDPSTAESIWHQCQQLLAEQDFGARGILRQMQVRMVGTTDDPLDDLRHHRTIADDADFDIDVLPTWRPDKVFKIEQDEFPGYVERLGAVVDVELRTFQDLLDALHTRLDHFEDHGCRAADHGVDTIRYVQPPTDAVLNRVLAKRLSGGTLDALEIAQFDSAVQTWLGRQYGRRDWVMQLHIGAQRNNNTRLFERLGPDAGFDSIGDRCIAGPLAQFLSALEQEDCLPKTILYCLNPSDNEVLATMVGNFQGGGVAGKMQFGSAWWFNDQKDGMIRQLNCLAQMSLLSRFVGMVTDSRSFLSYIRHEYFRRILCDQLGSWAEAGEVPADMDMLRTVVTDICYRNAQSYFVLTDRAPA